MRTIAVLNQKGGSAKTTTAVNVAAALAESGASVLLVDLDPQGSASAWLGVEDGSRGLLEVLRGNAAIADLVRPSSTTRLSVVPASPWLVGAERALAGEVGAETLLRAQLATLTRFDYVFVDCPPALGLLGVQALVGCRELLVPVTADPMALAGLAALLETHAHVKARLNQQLAVAGVVLCRVTRTRVSSEVLERLRKRFGRAVFRAIVHDAVRLTEAPSHHQPITAYAPASRAAAEYRAVARELARGRRAPSTGRQQQVTSNETSTRNHDLSRRSNRRS
jgi:chromosome partitioning protein